MVVKNGRCVTNRDTLSSFNFKEIKIIFIFCIQKKISSTYFSSSFYLVIAYDSFLKKKKYKILTISGVYFRFWLKQILSVKIRRLIVYNKTQICSPAEATKFQAGIKKNSFIRLLSSLTALMWRGFPLQMAGINQQSIPYNLLTIAISIFRSAMSQIATRESTNFQAKCWQLFGSFQSCGLTSDKQQFFSQITI